MVDLSSVSALGASLRHLLATVLEMAQVRLELLSTDWEMEKLRILDAVLWSAAALLALTLGVVMLCGLLLLLLWDSYRFVAIGAMGVVLLSMGALFLWQARRSMRSLQGFMAATVAELKRDQTELRGKRPHV